MMENFNIYLDTETEKYDFIRAAREAGARLDGVSGCGPGYYIQIAATPEQVEFINKTWYSPDINALTAREAWAAWKAGQVTAGQLVTWQERHGVTFDSAGQEVARA